MEDNQEEAEDEYYSDDPVIDPKIDWYYKLRSFAPIAILLLVTTIYLPSTVGGGVSLNSGSKIEFGQAVRQAIACSDTTDIKISAYSRFTNNLGITGIHYLETITVSNIPDSCYGADFSISAFGPSSSTPLAIYNETSTIATVYNKAGTFKPIAGSMGFSLISNTGSFIIGFTNPVARSTSIDKLTIQSNVHKFTCAEGGAICKVGDIGPGGGIVFYVGVGSFSCGLTLTARCSYLEAAPTSGTNNWTDSTNVGWGSTGTLLGTGTEIGTGLRNTSLWGGTSGAGYRARSYRGPNNLIDWYVPSKDENHQMCKWQRGQPWTSDSTVCTGTGVANTGLGAAGFISYCYFSSSEVLASTAWYLHFGTGAFGNNGSKSGTCTLRPIRAF